ncbi:hypothetical protein [Streptomyces cucumeris]|uniref:hypothetical protein n=1 Tax=Streptomyces cucumeris TaxID=2962890 RepID=UPI0020C933E5|nr:hypothetical protein [Streptomyces sp. NEAU-Y11]MCP9209524.1 hypothetical protein [Streptomyces sp. NEAU-Y11]
MDGKIYAPWSTEEVGTLNRFQREGGMHPFTCGALHGGDQSPALLATPLGWVCPVLACEYTQDWVHAFMVNPEKWPGGVLALQLGPGKPDPIRRSDLLPTPEPEWEYATHFSRPDGGGDWAPGRLRRGAQVRRLVVRGEWEPVRPDCWAEEPAFEAGVTSHAYEGDGGPCSAEAYGQTCGAPRDTHELDEAREVSSVERKMRCARYEDAFGEAMRLGLQGAELYDEPGAQRINEWIKWITDAVMEVADSEQAELRTQLAAAQQVTPATYQTCRACGAGYRYGQPCQTCEFQAQMKAAAPAEERDC